MPRAALAIVVAILAACGGPAEAPKRTVAPPATRTAVPPSPSPVAARWDLREDRGSVVAILRSDSLTNPAFVTAVAEAEYPTLTLSCNKGRLGVSFESPRWKEKSPVTAAFNEEEPVSYHATAQRGSLHVAPAPFLAALRGRGRLVAQYHWNDLIPTPETAKFDLGAIGPVLSALEKGCRLPEAAPPRASGAAGTAWTVRKQVSPAGEPGVVLVQKGKQDAELYIRCRWDSIDVFLTAGQVLEEGRPVTVRMDDGPRKEMKTTASMGSRALFLPNPRQQLAGLLGHRTLAVSYTYFQETTGREDTFDLTGLDALVGPYRKTCGLPPDRPARP
jgi:hypothetical protein